MTQYWEKNDIYVATTDNSCIIVYLNQEIHQNDYTFLSHVTTQRYKEIPRSEFHKAYKQTRAMIDSAYSRLNMIETDELIPQATEQDKRDEEERFPADDEHPDPVHEREEFNL